MAWSAQAAGRSAAHHRHCQYQEHQTLYARPRHGHCATAECCSRRLCVGLPASLLSSFHSRNDPPWPLLTTLPELHCPSKVAGRERCDKPVFYIASNRSFSTSVFWQNVTGAQGRLSQWCVSAR